MMKNNVKNKKFSDDIDKSAKNLLEARKEKKSFWRYAYIIGVGGWLFVIPVVAGAYLGRYIDRKIQGGISWTITLIIIGIAVGIYNIWQFYIKESGR
jgi:ATP synthase protein I